MQSPFQNCFFVYDKSLITNPKLFSSGLQILNSWARSRNPLSGCTAMKTAAKRVHGHIFQSDRFLSFITFWVEGGLLVGQPGRLKTAVGLLAFNQSGRRPSCLLRPNGLFHHHLLRINLATCQHLYKINTFGLFADVDRGIARL